MNTSESEKIRKIVTDWQPDAEVVSLSALTPDASLRRYFRVSLSGAEVQSCLAMVFDSVECPEHGGGVKVNSDDAFVGLLEFFGARGVPVPALYHDARELGFLLIEDLGDRHLIDYLAEGEVNELRTLYRQAIDQIIVIQEIEPEPDFFAYQRSFTAKQYFNEMLELRDYTLKPFAVSASAIEMLERSFASLAEELAQRPKVLVHRDFHSWNLMVDPKGAVRVLDFQDALLATRCYDLAGLLNDRDSDSLLGKSLHAELLEYFFSKQGSDPELREEYYRVLLQRDLKVAGRFAKLSALRGLTQYEKWIPGTLRRIGRSSSFILSMESAPEWVGELQTVLCGFLPDVQDGVAEVGG